VAAGGLTAFTRNTKSACAPACPSSMCVYTIACSEHVSIEQCSFSRPHARTLTRPETPDCSCGALLCAHTKAAFILYQMLLYPHRLPACRWRLGGARGVRERDTRADGARAVVLRRQRHRETSRPRDPACAARGIARARAHRHTVPADTRVVCARRVDGPSAERGAHRGESHLVCVCGDKRVWRSHALNAERSLSTAHTHKRSQK
jgi:hypothetical protein